MAFGVLRDKDVDGTPMVMPRLIRTRQNSELINLCRLYLNDLGLESVSDQMFYKYINSFPAAQQKICVGVNPFHELAMTSFENLREIVSKVVPWIGSDTGKQLHNGIATAHTYVRYCTLCPNMFQ